MTLTRSSRTDRILFRKNCLSALEPRTLPGEKAFVIAPAGALQRESRRLAYLEQQLQLSGLRYVFFELFSPVTGSPQIARGTSFARRRHCDFVLALGDNSVLHAAHAIAAGVVNPGQIRECAALPQPLICEPLPIVRLLSTAEAACSVARSASNTLLSSIQQPCLFLIDPCLPAASSRPLLRSTRRWCIPAASHCG